MNSSQRVRLWVAVLAIGAVGIALRMVPLYWSPLPFNPDGIVYAGFVHEARLVGHLPLDRMGVDELFFTSLLAVVSEVTGSPALYSAQPAIAIVGTIPALLAAGITLRIGRRLRFSLSARYLGVSVAGLLLAIEGLYLHRSMPVDEQTVGLLFVPLIAIGLARAHLDWRWYGVCLPVMGVLPAVHNLDSFVLGLFLTVWLIAGIHSGSRSRMLRRGVLTIGFWGHFLLYSVGVEAFTPARIIQAGRLLAAPGLLLAWVILVGAFVVWITGRSPRFQRLSLGLLFGAFFGLLALNVVAPVFPGMPTTARPLLAMIAPLGVVALLAVWAIPSLPRRGGERAVLFGLLGAPVVLIGFSLTASLTPEYLNTLYRVQTFLHFPVIVLAGVGVVLLGTRSRLPNRRVTMAVLAAGVLLAAAMSIPIAFAGLELLSYKGITTPAEFSSSEYATQHTTGPWASDDHLSRISRYYPANQTVGTLPLYEWFNDRGAPPSCPVLSQRSWTSTGAQIYPKSPITIAETVYLQWQQRQPVVYATSSTDPIHLVMPPRSDGRGC